jgi:hypothetical protein
MRLDVYLRWDGFRKEADFSSDCFFYASSQKECRIFEEVFGSCIGGEREFDFVFGYRRVSELLSAYIVGENGGGSLPVLSFFRSFDGVVRRISAEKAAWVGGFVAFFRRGIELQLGGLHPRVRLEESEGDGVGFKLRD